MLAGGHVVLAVRDTDAGLRSIDEIKKTAVERGIDPTSLRAEVGLNKCTIGFVCDADL
jgi:hypothetical protein